MQPSEIIDPPHTRANLKLLETSIRKEFPISEQILAALPNVMMSLVASDKATKREKISAARVIVAMQNSNQPVVQAHIHKHVQEISLDHQPPLEPAADGPITIDERKRRCQERIDRLDKLGRI